jgi:hypothetical protein
MKWLSRRTLLRHAAFLPALLASPAKAFIPNDDPVVHLPNGQTIIRPENKGTSIPIGASDSQLSISVPVSWAKQLEGQLIEIFKAQGKRDGLTDRQIQASISAFQNSVQHDPLQLMLDKTADFVLQWIRSRSKHKKA